MKKNAFIEKRNDLYVVRVHNIELAKFKSESDALEWAFALGFRVYKKVIVNHHDVWVQHFFNQL
ncbi:hypothetical protein MZP69_005029 [Klebsiella oxytoca]|nr:hypothetical protein [Klebsiella oxytoca]